MNTATEHLHNLSALPTWVEGPLQEARLWVPSERISLHVVPVPSAPERRWADLLPWMLEDRVLQPVEQMHFVVLGRLDEKQLLVAAVSRSDMNLWLSMAATVGLSPRCMVPDYLALPWEKERWTVCMSEGRCLVRTGALTGFAAPAEVVWSLIERELSRQEVRPRLSISAPESDQIPESIARSADINGSVLNWTFAEMPGTVNLMVGEFRHREPAFRLRPWLPSAALAASVLLLAVIYLLLATRISREEVEVLQREVRDTYGQIFMGSIASTEEIRQHVEEAVDRLSHQNEALSAEARELLRALDGVLSRCNCDLREVKVEAGGATLTLGNTPDLKKHFLALKEAQLQWSEEDDRGLVQLQIKLGKG